MEQPVGLSVFTNRLLYTTGSHSGPKHVGVDVLKHFCNSNEVYTFVDLLFNDYFGINLHVCTCINDN
jgi:hypothetical protein